MTFAGLIYGVQTACKILRRLSTIEQKFGIELNQTGLTHCYMPENKK